MQLYRKPDQYYIDQYDRSTIKTLKELEEKERAKIWKDPIYHPNSDRIMQERSYNCFTEFYSTAVHLARNREIFIRGAMANDERKDMLVKHSTIPNDVHCNTCGSKMKCDTHMFREDDTVILFVFGCPKDHLPRKLIYPNGKEYFFPVRKCNKCGSSSISSSTETKANLVIFTDTCDSCGEVNVLESELGSEDQGKPISKDDKKKYCIDLINSTTFEEDLKAVSDFAEKYNISVKNKAEKEEYEYDKIKTLTLPQLEIKLSKMAEGIGLVKFQFEKPQINKHVIVDFSAQDPTDRNNSESIKIFTKGIKEDLQLTNWRLMATGIIYRLGILSGQLKAYETEDDLMRLAKQIKKANSGKS